MLEKLFAYINAKPVQAAPPRPSIDHSSLVMPTGVVLLLLTVIWVLVLSDALVSSQKSTERAGVDSPSRRSDRRYRSPVKTRSKLE